jgi:hypothetical protein
MILILLAAFNPLVIAFNYKLSGFEIFTSSSHEYSEKTISTSILKIENIAGGRGINGIIKNIGDTNILNISIQIDVNEGLILIPLTTDYEIPILHVGESTDLNIRLFGLGMGIITNPPEIKITIETPDNNIIEITVIAKIFGSFVNIIGVFFNYIDSFNGYTLFGPEFSRNTYLINNSGDVVHTWESNYIQGLTVHLLENGNLMRTSYTFNPVFMAGGITGIIEMFDWFGIPIWEFEYSNGQHCLHHDFEVMPNGNLLLIAWEYKTVEEAINAGRHPEALQAGKLWPDHIIEVKPNNSSGGDIIWEWHVWDHLIQDYDPSKDNFGVIADHPELVDINFGIYDGKAGPDWNHINSIDYNEEFDQILLIAHNQNEIWIIDHSTTTQEASSHSGGNSGKGGDLLYRWGNPQVYQAGSAADQKLFGQHDAQWIDSECPGAKNILIFNNGQGRPQGRYSSIEEIIPPVDAYGTYSYTPGNPYLPTEPIWIYTAENPLDFYAGHISGAQRLPNGNTLICDGPNGLFFEVTMEKNTVWEYLNMYPNLDMNHVFQIHRYPPDYPGLSNLFQ